MSMVKNIGPLYKFLVAFVGAVIVGAGNVFDDGSVHGIAEWSTLLAAIGTAVAVIVVPELHDGVARMAKAIAAAMVTLAADLPVVLVDRHLSSGDWITLAVNVAVALGVLVIPNVGYTRALKVARTSKH
jgi:drug/metabolite transporter (DMT)-like permease